MELWTWEMIRISEGDKEKETGSRQISGHVQTWHANLSESFSTSFPQFPSLIHHLMILSQVMRCASQCLFATNSTCSSGMLYKQLWNWVSISLTVATHGAKVHRTTLCKRSKTVPPLQSPSILFCCVILDICAGVCGGCDCGGCDSGGCDCCAWFAYLCKNGQAECCQRPCVKCLCSCSLSSFDFMSFCRQDSYVVWVIIVSVLHLPGERHEKKRFLSLPFFSSSYCSSIFGAVVLKWWHSEVNTHVEIWYCDNSLYLVSYLLDAKPADFQRGAVCYLLLSDFMLALFGSELRDYLILQCANVN